MTLMSDMMGCLPVIVDDNHQEKFKITNHNREITQLWNDLLI